MYVWTVIGLHRPTEGVNAVVALVRIPGFVRVESTTGCARALKLKRPDRSTQSSPDLTGSSCDPSGPSLKETLRQLRLHGLLVGRYHIKYQEYPTW